jgi:hypothetical protein
MRRAATAIAILVTPREGKVAAFAAKEEGDGDDEADITMTATP